MCRKCCYSRILHPISQRIVTNLWFWWQLVSICVASYMSSLAPFFLDFVSWFLYIKIGLLCWVRCNRWDKKYLVTSYYHEKSKFYKNYNLFWVIENSKPLIDKLNVINTKNKAREVSTFDFSTLYTNLTSVIWTIPVSFPNHF